MPPQARSPFCVWAALSSIRLGRVSQCVKLLWYNSTDFLFGHPPDTIIAGFVEIQVGTVVVVDVVVVVVVVLVVVVVVSGVLVVLGVASEKILVVVVAGVVVLLIGVVDVEVDSGEEGQAQHSVFFEVPFMLNEGLWNVVLF